MSRGYNDDAQDMLMSVVEGQENDDEDEEEGLLGRIAGA